MDPKKLAQAAAPAKLGSYLARKPSANQMSHMGHGAGGASVREEVYKGHKITIRTAYRVEIDGKLVKAPLIVDDAGHVHCHSLPNYQTPSAVGMVEALIAAKAPKKITQKRQP